MSDDTPPPQEAEQGPLPFPDIPARQDNPIELLRVPARVHRVFVWGNKRTKRELIDAELAPAVSATTHHQLALELALATERLEQLDIFKSAECSVDVCSVPDAGDNALDVVLNVEEKGTHTLSTGTYMQGGEGNAEVSWTMRNMFGNAELVKGNASMGHKTSNTFRLEGSQPLAFGSPLRFSMAAFQSNVNHVKYSSFRERQRGVNVALTNISDGESTHELWYEAAWRTVTLEPGALVCPPEEAGDSFISSIRHVYTYDTREDPRLPQTGALLRSTSELAGFSGDVKFFKNTLEVQQHLATDLGVSFAVSGQLGFLQGLAGQGSRINDRFFLGGPVVMRGFRTKGLGPRGSAAGSSGAAACAKGGDAFFSAALTATFDLPSRVLEALNIKGHVFCNVGNNIAVGAGRPVWKQFPSMLANYRAVLGAGLVVPMQVGRLEANYCFPMRVFPELGDRFARWQLGLAFET